MYNVPNLLSDTVYIGEHDEDSKPINTFYKLTKKKKQYSIWILQIQLGNIDTEKTILMPGSKYVTFKSVLAKLHRSLINFMLDVNSKEHNFEEVCPPVRKIWIIEVWSGAGSSYKWWRSSL
jgi:seryl-tRNA synthetase